MGIAGGIIKVELIQLSYGIDEWERLIQTK